MSFLTMAETSMPMPRVVHVLLIYFIFYVFTMDIILYLVVGVVAFAVGAFGAIYISKRNAKSGANEILDKAKLEAEVLKNNEVIKGKEEGMAIKSEAEKQANQRLQKVQASEAKAKQREMQLNQQQGEVQRRRNELDTLKQQLDSRTKLQLLGSFYTDEEYYGGGEEESIENVPAIDRNAPMFDILGRPVGKGYHGFVIQNGHKYLLQ